MTFLIVHGNCTSINAQKVKVPYKVIIHLKSVYVVSLCVIIFKNYILTNCCYLLVDLAVSLSLHVGHLKIPD